MKKNVFLVIFIITTVIAAGFAVFFKFDGDKEIEGVQSKLKEAVSIQETQSTQLQQAQEKIEQTTKATTATPQVVEKVVKENTFYPTLDSSKCINPSGNAKYELRISQEFVPLTCLVNSDKKSAVLTTDWDYAHNVWGFTPNGGNGAYEQYTANNFSSEIVDVVSTGWGQTSDYSTLLFLMKDGTVEYLPVHKAYKFAEFKSFGKISGVSNIAYIGNATATYGEEPIAMKADGTFYRLSDLLEKTGNYKF